MLNSADTRKTPEPQDDVVELLAPKLHNFSLVREGPLYRLARITVLATERERLGPLGVIIGLIGWAPLVVLCAFQNILLTGPRVPFYESLGTHVRFLFAIPLFLSRRRGSMREPAKFSESLSGPGSYRSLIFHVM
jgi:hypothetical protein